MPESAATIYKKLTEYTFPPKCIIGEEVSLTEDEAEILFSMIEKYIDIEYEKRELSEIIDALPNKSFLIAAVFFVRYKYSYTGGFWKPFLEGLDIKIGNSEYHLFKKKFDKAFDLFGLYKPEGERKECVKPLLYHSVLPNDGIDRFAKIIASESEYWDYWSDTDDNDIKEYLKTRTLSANLKRILNNERSDIITSLFRDVCYYLSSGKKSGDSNALNVPGIANRVRIIIENEPSQHTQRRSSRQWGRIRGEWIWDKATNRIKLEIPSFKVPVDTETDYIQLKAGSKTLDIDIKEGKNRTSPVFIDAFYINDEISSPEITLMARGKKKESIRIAGLDLSAPLIEINGYIKNIKDVHSVPSKAYWLLPPGITSDKSVELVNPKLSPYPLLGWACGTYKTSDRSWKFSHNGIENTEYIIPVEKEVCWMLSDKYSCDNIAVNDPNVPVYLKNPFIDLLGVSDGVLEYLVCDIKNLSSNEKQSVKLSDLISNPQEPYVTHTMLAATFKHSYGIFELRLMKSSSRSLGNKQMVIKYCVLPFAEYTLPEILTPDDSKLEFSINDKIPGIQFKGSTRSTPTSALWDIHSDPQIIINDNDFYLELFPEVPKVWWYYKGKWSHDIIDEDESIMLDSEAKLILGLDSTQPAAIVGESGNIVLEPRQQNIANWEIKFTELFEAIQNSTSDIVELFLAHAGSKYNLMRIRRKLSVELFEVNTPSDCSSLDIHIKLSRKTDDNLFLLLYNTSITTIDPHPIPLEPFNIEYSKIIPLPSKIDDGKYNVFLFSGDMNNPTADSQILLDDMSNPKPVRASFVKGNELAVINESPESMAVALQIHGRWNLPISWTLTRQMYDRVGAKVYRTLIDELLKFDDPYYVRNVMQNLEGNGLNIGLIECNALIDKDNDELLNMWQPLGVIRTVSEYGDWTEKGRIFIGQRHVNPFWLPENAIVSLDHQLYQVMDHQPLRTSGNLMIFPVMKQSDHTKCYLGISDNDYNGCIISEDDLDELFVSAEDLKPLVRLKFNNKISIFENNSIAVMKLIAGLLNGDHIPDPILEFIIPCITGKHSVMSVDYFVKAFYECITNAKNNPQARQFITMAIEDEGNLHAWQRDHLGDNKYGNQYNEYGELLTDPAKEILLKLSHHIEDVFPSNQSLSSFPGFVFVVALYNRLAARYPHKTRYIRPKARGEKWLQKQSADCFKHSRLLFNYFLILNECILAWWNDALWRAKRNESN